MQLFDKCNERGLRLYRISIYYTLSYITKWQHNKEGSNKAWLVGKTLWLSAQRGRRLLLYMIVNWMLENLCWTWHWYSFDHLLTKFWTNDESVLDKTCLFNCHDSSFTSIFFFSEGGCWSAWISLGSWCCHHLGEYFFWTGHGCSCDQLCNGGQGSADPKTRPNKSTK